MKNLKKRARAHEKQAQAYIYFLNQLELIFIVQENLFIFNMFPLQN